MKIAVRMDDITPAMDWERFGAFRALLEEYDIKPLIGVVPDNQDGNLNRGEWKEDFWQQVKAWQKSGWVIAQHGYRHVYTTQKGGMFPLNDFAEFAGMPFARQLEMVKRGREILAAHGIETDLFMAPAHAYDKNTLRALSECGFRRMTDGFGTRPYLWRGLTFYPISFRLGSSLKKERGYTTMVVHTNTMNKAELERYRQIFEKHDMISYGEYLEEQPVKRRFPGRAWEYVMAAAKHVLVKYA